jgi:hypothetical protein
VNNARRESGGLRGVTRGTEESEKT